ncbi:WDR54 protein, partial [Glaucidium brasilianum]|nr:WDR54 protein [Glaucidium brasilianum]
GPGGGPGPLLGGCAAPPPGAAPPSRRGPADPAPPGRRYRKEPSIPLRSTPPALYNNLSVLRLPGGPPPALSAVHGPSLSLLSAPPDGLGFSQRQLQPKEGGMAVSTSLLTQAAWCVLPARVLLPPPSQRGIQMYESDGSIMVYWHALDVAEHSPARAVFARGIAAAGERPPCVGTSSGLVLVFDIPPKGTNVTLSDVLPPHRDAITDIAAELGQAPAGAGDLVTPPDAGTLCVWSTGEEFAPPSKIPAFGCPPPSVKLWNGIVAAGYGPPQIRLYEAATGLPRAEPPPHARWIYALDVAPQTPPLRPCRPAAPGPQPTHPPPPSLPSQLLSGAEDSPPHVWQLSRNPDTGEVVTPPVPAQIEHRHAECVTDTQVCGAPPPDPEGNSFAVTGYDLTPPFRYSRV